MLDGKSQINLCFLLYYESILYSNTLYCTVGTLDASNAFALPRSSFGHSQLESDRTTLYLSFVIMNINNVRNSSVFDVALNNAQLPSKGLRRPLETQKTKLISFTTVTYYPIRCNPIPYCAMSKVQFCRGRSIIMVAVERMPHSTRNVMFVPQKQSRQSRCYCKCEKLKTCVILESTYSTQGYCSKVIM